jgi:hypothetical protein
MPRHPHEGFTLNRRTAGPMSEQDTAASPLLTWRLATSHGLNYVDVASKPPPRLSARFKLLRDHWIGPGEVRLFALGGDESVALTN